MEQMLLQIVGVVTAAVEYVRPMLNEFEFFSNLTKQQQAIVLQTIAWVFAAIGCFSQNVNVFGVPGEIGGTIATAFLVGLGGQAIHVGLALLGKLGNSVGQTSFKSEVTGDVVVDENYAAWS